MSKIVQAGQEAAPVWRRHTFLWPGAAIARQSCRILFRSCICCFCTTTAAALWKHVAEAHGDRTAQQQLCGQRCAANAQRSSLAGSAAAARAAAASAHVHPRLHGQVGLPAWKRLRLALACQLTLNNTAQWSRHDKAGPGAWL